MVEPGRRGLMIPRARAMMISPGTVSLLRSLTARGHLCGGEKKEAPHYLAAPFRKMEEK